MTAVSTLFFYPHCTMDDSRAGLQGLVSVSEARESPRVPEWGVLLTLDGFLCSAGLSSEVNYVRLAMPAQPVYTASLFFLLQ